MIEVGILIGLFIGGIVAFVAVCLEERGQ